MNLFLNKRLFIMLKPKFVNKIKSIEKKGKFSTYKSLTDLKRAINKKLLK